VDIDPNSLNIDPAKIEAAITPRTSAILAVHCYGHPCDVEAIQAIADKHGLKVIYDAAHAFGVQGRDGKSILTHGDLSILSFHATKVFTTFEGGAIICHNKGIKKRIDLLKNFGIADEVTVEIAGLNGKMSEINAAFGLLHLTHIDGELALREAVDRRYRDKLKDVVGIHCLPDTGEKRANYSYFPVLIEADYPLSRDQLYDKLKENNIFARRYFYPLISDFPMYKTLPSATHANLPVAAAAAQKVLCLPMYPHLTHEDQDMVVDLIKGGV
jgi:dTDP-4-amino-4,6-dideoxygalactose transaminase